MAEQILLDRNNVRITLSRMQVRKASYAISGITSVETKTEKASFGWQILLGVLGVIVALGGVGADSSMMTASGLAIWVVGLAWAWIGRPRYYVSLRLAGAEIAVLRSNQKHVIEDVAVALNQAITLRG